MVSVVRAGATLRGESLFEAFDANRHRVSSCPVATAVVGVFVPYPCVAVWWQDFETAIQRWQKQTAEAVKKNKAAGKK